VQVTKLVKKLKNVAEGHIPLNIVPDFGGEDLNDNSELKKAEQDLVKRLCEEMDADARLILMVFVYFISNT